MHIFREHAIDALVKMPEKFYLLATDPPYAFGGSGGEHALSATVAIALREYGQRVTRNGWAVVFCASSWRSTSYMVESLRGVMEPVRIATWVKPSAKSKVQTPGWGWASVNVLLFKKGKPTSHTDTPFIDWIAAPPVTRGRRAELPERVCAWAVGPFTKQDEICVDPFAGSCALLKAAEFFGMKGYGAEIKKE